FPFAAASAARASDVYRYEVKRGSDLKKELGYKLSVQDEHEKERSQGMDAVIPIEGPAPDYFVKFHASVAGKLKDLFELDLTLTDATGTLLRVPLAIRIEMEQRERSRRSLPDQEGLDQSGRVDDSLCPRMSAHPEAIYSIRLGDYAPCNAGAAQSPTPRSTLIPGPYHVIR